MARTGSDPTDRHRVVFTPAGRVGDVDAGSTVLEAARVLGVDLDSVCGGRGICGRCQVTPVPGHHARWALDVGPDAVADPAGVEAGYRGRRPLADGRRLGCALQLRGDVVIDVPPESQVHRQVIRKEVAISGLTLDPSVVLRSVPALDTTAGPSVTARLRAALADRFDLHGIAVDPAVLPGLHAAAAGADGLTVALRGDRVVAAWPGFVDRVAGVAVDVGSTTIAGHLCDLGTGEVLASAGRMNPQIRFGEDLMSRVSYAMTNPGGAAAMTDAVHGALDELVDELTSEASLPRDRVLELVVVGNPVMHHLVLGIDPTPLGQAPFVLATHDPADVPAAALGFTPPAANVHVGPCIAGHVGADTAAAILAEGPHRGDEVTLLVDVGTNAEVVIGNASGLFAASSPTGPALEGAQISGGQRATFGAIERVRIDRDTLEPRVQVIGVAAWSDEPGFAAAVRPTGVSGICGSGIIEAIGELFLAGVIDSSGAFRPEAAGTSERVVADGRTHAYLLHEGRRELLITQEDVRAVQLAKAALRAGIDLLLERAPFDRIEHVVLTGAFGARIDPTYALLLGMIPDAPLERVRAVGNAAGAGAVRALLSRAERDEMAAVARQVTKVETALEPRFQELFVAALDLPHRDSAHPHLARIVDLPPADDAGVRGRRRGRRRTQAPPDQVRLAAASPRRTGEARP